MKVRIVAMAEFEKEHATTNARTACKRIIASLEKKETRKELTTLTRFVDRVKKQLDVRAGAAEENGCWRIIGILRGRLWWKTRRREPAGYLDDQLVAPKYQRRIVPNTWSQSVVLTL
jgi:hypothetical protein